LMFSSSQPDGTPVQRWCSHHHRMVRRAGIDMFIITTSWYAAPAMIGTSSLPNGTPSWRRWLHHHRRIIRRLDINGYTITVGCYAGPALMDIALPPDRMPTQRRWLHPHRWIVRRAGGGKTSSRAHGTPDRRW
jgi:hypothetical protein